MEISPGNIYKCTLNKLITLQAFPSKLNYLLGLEVLHSNAIVYRGIFTGKIGKDLLTVSLLVNYILVLNHSYHTLG